MLDVRKIKNDYLKDFDRIYEDVYNICYVNHSASSYLKIFNSLNWPLKDFIVARNIYFQDSNIDTDDIEYYMENYFMDYIYKMVNKEDLRGYVEQEHQRIIDENIKTLKNFEKQVEEQKNLSFSTTNIKGEIE